MDPILRDVQLEEGRVTDPAAFPFALPAVRALREPLAFHYRLTRVFLEAPERFLRQLFA